MKYIKDYAEGNKIQGIYFCKHKTSTETKTGKPYDSLLLQDRTGVLDCKVWEPYSPGIREYEAGDFIEVYGDVIVFNNAKQAKISNIRKAEEGEYNPADYLPVSKKDIANYMKKQQKEANEPINNAFAEAFAKLKL